MHDELLAREKIVGCDLVNEHINKPIPKPLWHYTSFAAFQGILASKKIWATEYRFLNDREEFRHAKDLAQKLVDEEPEVTGTVFPARDMLRKGVNIAFNTGHLHEERLYLMVASFSEEGDQLSQWRGYANNSRGISIGLDLSALRPPSNIGTAVTFAPCVYELNQKTSLLKAVFAHYRSALQQWWDSIISIAMQKSGGVPGRRSAEQLLSEHQKELNAVMVHSQTTLQFDLLRIAPLLKDESFAEEKEWRLVLPWERIKLPTGHPIEFRAKPANVRTQAIKTALRPIRSPSNPAQIEPIINPTLPAVRACVSSKGRIFHASTSEGTA